MVGIIGIVIVKLTIKKQTQSADVLTKNMESINTSIDNIVINLVYNPTYITFDNFEIKNQHWDGACVWGSDRTFEVGGASYIIIRNMHIHSWTHGPASTTDDCLHIINGQTSYPYNQGSSLEYSEIENSATPDSAFAVYNFQQPHRQQHSL